MCSRSKSDAKRHHFHPHASMTKHTPESNERDYAVYKIWQAKRHMTHMAGEEGLSLIDPSLHLQTTVSLWQHSAETTSDLVGSAVFSPRIKSSRSKEEPPEGAEMVTQLMYSGTPRHTNTNPRTPAHPFVDLIECTIEMRPFCELPLTHRRYFL